MSARHIAGTGAQSALPRYPTRTKWVLAGASEGEIGAREKAERAAGRLGEPVPGVSCLMMSRLGRWTGNWPGPWRPHVLFYFSGTLVSSCGADLPVFLEAARSVAGFPPRPNNSSR